MKARKRKYVVMAQMQPVGEHCDLCHGARGGVRGNNVIIDGKQVCDYCHSDLMDIDAMPDSEINYSDIPKADDAPERLQNATVGKFYRAINKEKKQ